METVPYHIPALLPQALEALDVKPSGVYVDATYGGGGHARAVAERLDAAAGGHLYGFDQDQDAAARAMRDPRFTMVLANFRYLANFMRYHGVGAVDGVLADLGVSFHHFDDPARGFTFRQDAPLDMRMNQRAPLTAAQLLARMGEEELADTFRVYGELRQGRQLARALCRRRDAGSPVATVSALLEVAEPLMDPRRAKKDMACVFQALRIKVNDEMGALRDMLRGALKVLRPGGRLVVITYHSLEDRLVKNFMRSGNFEGKVEKDFYGRVLSPLRPLPGYPVTPGAQEVERNPRSRSAKLRAAVKTEESEN